MLAATSCVTGICNAGKHCKAWLLLQIVCMANALAWAPATHATSFDVMLGAVY